MTRNAVRNYLVLGCLVSLSLVHLLWPSEASQPVAAGPQGARHLRGPQHRPGQHGRPHRRHRRRRERSQDRLRRHRLRRPVEDHRQRRHLDADLRPPNQRLHRRRRRVAVEPQHRLGRHRRAQRPQQRRLGRRRLQIDRRRQDLAAHGPQGFAHHRPHRHSSDEPRHRLRRRPGPPLGAEQGTRHLQDDRRRQDLGGVQVHRREHRLHRPGDGPRRSRHPLRRGLPRPPRRLLRRQPGDRASGPAPACTRPPTAARPGTR